MGIERDQASQPEEKDQLYWKIFEAVGDGLIVQDSESQRVVEANSAAAAMHGYGHEEFIGLHLTEYIHPDSQSLFAESAKRSSWVTCSNRPPFTCAVMAHHSPSRCAGRHLLIRAIRVC